MRFIKGVTCVPVCSYRIAHKWHQHNLPFQRHFFGSSRENRVMAYAERRTIGFTADQMFDVVNTVSDYPKFVPYCKKADVRKVSENVLEADLQIGFPPLHERYSSKVTALKPLVVRSVCTDGRLFNVLDTTWRFHPHASNEKCCVLHYSIEFEFRSALHARLAHLFFDQVVRTMVNAFLKRAEKLYGTPAIDFSEMKPEILTFKG